MFLEIVTMNKAGHEWHIKSKCLDLICYQDNLYIACQDALYELQLPNSKNQLALEDEEDHEDFFRLFGSDNEGQPKPKRPCMLTDIKVQKALLKVKFKREAICFCHDSSRGLLYSLHSKGHDTVYVEATDLSNFQTCNPSLCMIKDQKAVGKPWMLVEGRSFFLFLNQCYRGLLNDSITMDHQLEPMPGIRLKIDLYLQGLVSRPNYPGDDLLEQVLDKQRLEDKSNNHRVLKESFQDLRFLSHERLVVLTSNGSLREYRKDGRVISKVDILASHVLLMTAMNGLLYFVTRYGSIYRLKDKGQTREELGNNYSNNEALTDTIIKSSRDLQDLVAQHKEKTAMLQQLQLALELEAMKTHVHIDNDKMLILSMTYQDGSGKQRPLVGKYWSLHLSANLEGNIHKIFVMHPKN